MKNQDYKLCAVLPAYQAGNPIPIEQHLNTSIDIFGLRKYLERYKLNEWHLKIIKVSNPGCYCLGVDLDKSEITEYDEIIRQMAKIFDVEPTAEAVAVVINKTIELFIKH